MMEARGKNFLCSVADALCGVGVCGLGKGVEGGLTLIHDLPLTTQPLLSTNTLHYSIRLLLRVKLPLFTTDKCSKKENLVPVLVYSDNIGDDIDIPVNSE